MLIPSQKIEYLGFVIYSCWMTLSLPPEKVTKIQAKCCQVLQQRFVRVCQLSHLIGMLTATILALLPAPLHYRHLQMQKSKALLAGHYNYNTQVVLDLECKSELKWWFRHLQDWNGKSLISPAPDLVNIIDLLMMGWVAVCNVITTQRLWSPSEKLDHINVLELNEAMFAVMVFAKNLSQIHIHLRMDNQASVAQINKLGGGGVQVTSTVQNHQGFLGFLPLATDHNYCRPCPRSPEPNSRSGIPGFSGQELLDLEQVIFSTNREYMGRGRYRYVCGPTDDPEEGSCQLETRSKGSDNGCIHNAVGRPKNVCIPRILSGGSLPSQSSKGSGISHVDCASLASLDVVSDTVGNVGISPDSVANIGGPTALPQSSTSIDSVKWANSSLRGRLQTAGFSQDS